ncbi:EamA family transporter RarD [Glutamicibacter sp. JL.03c]|uniref:EamA family transporter RarD n=1 Tax=Glutamicibacter sp. JL.03c TaxID=2984842 RepID=UPI0021F7E919|nr:EamA family transporter RarD [Glutamicibacter sp. JL.03c]UYQ76651.1 EamA family transporter RarD [Glutamicibacter sp. JL.03c]
MSSSTTTPVRSEHSYGLIQGTSAYLIWGLLPAYFLLLPQISAVEFVAVRVLFSLIFCFILLAATSQIRQFATMFRDTKTMGQLALASVLIAANWVLYALAVLTGHVLEASLGYFINPIVAILLGVIVLKEKLRPLQWAAVGLATVAVIVLTVGLGRVPWISLGLAFSFGFYGLVKNKVGTKGSALGALSIETLWLTPLSIIYVIWLSQTSGSTLLDSNWASVLLLASSGIITAVPLLLFGGAARRLPLSTVGSLQFIAPLLQFILGVLVFGEHMPVERWMGFILVWIAVIFVLIDMLRAPRAGRLPEPKKIN